MQVFVVKSSRSEVPCDNYLHAGYSPAGKSVISDSALTQLVILLSIWKSACACSPTIGLPGRWACSRENELCAEKPLWAQR